MSADEWRRCSPADAVGHPVVTEKYAVDLAALAMEQGVDVVAGMTLTADYRCVDGKWYAKPETIRSSR